MQHQVTNAYKSPDVETEFVDKSNLLSTESPVICIDAIFLIVVSTGTINLPI